MAQPSSLLALAMLLYCSSRALGQVSQCSDIQATLAQHNTFRARHGSVALVWSDQLAATAQTWANGQAAQGCTIFHSNAPGIGENLDTAWNTAGVAPTCTDAVIGWYNEIVNPGYRFTQTPFTDNRFGVGHFTQVVWRETTSVGCGLALGRNERGAPCKVVACQYSPQGNWAFNELQDIAYFRNVQPPTTNAPVPITPVPATPAPAPGSGTTPGTGTGTGGPVVLNTTLVTSKCPDLNTTFSLHNVYRNRHGAANVTWNATLATQAQVWANQLASAGCDFQFSNAPDTGENVYVEFGTNQNGTCGGAVDSWYSNGAGIYTFSNTPYTDNSAKNVFGFTQIVWRGVSAVGCGVGTGVTNINTIPVATAGTWCKVVVCQYTPSASTPTDQAFFDNVKPVGTPVPPPTSTGTTTGPSGNPVTPSTPSGTPSTTPGTTTTPATPATAQCPDATASLTLHNTYRARHGANPLTWSDTLAAAAQGVATRNAAAGCTVDSSNTPNVGENTYSEWGSNQNGSCAGGIEFWYSALTNPGYVFSSTPYTDNGLSNVWGFTQIVWSSTTAVGCGVAQGTTTAASNPQATPGTWCKVVVCQYSPAGNTPNDDATWFSNVRPVFF